MKKILIIIFLGLLIYLPVLFNGFVWDDEVFIQGISSLQSSQAGTYFRPVISFIYSSIYNVFGPNPFFFHFFQLIFHIATAVLIYYLFKKFFKETVAFILALIFLIHPANVEAVSFASAMQDVAFTLVGIIAVYLLVIPTARLPARQEVEGSSLKDSSTHARNDIGIFKIFFATFFLIIALLMKETAIVFFPLVFCYLIIFRKKQPKVLINYSLFSLILLMGYFLARISSGSLYVQGQGLFPIMRVSLATRLINIPLIILFYLEKIFFPINLAIAQQWVIRTVDFYHFFLPLTVEVLLLAGAIFYIVKKKDKFFIFFFFWFLIGLLPHLQLIPLNMTVAERWLYFPMIGILGMIGSLRLDPHLHGDDKQTTQHMSFPLRRESSLLFLLGILIIILFSIRSFVRSLDWHSGLALYNRDIRKDSSFDLQNNMGVELFRIGKYDQAKKYFEISVKLAPYWWVNWNNLGAAYEQEKNYKKAGEYYRKSINNGQYYLAYENLAKILVFHGGDKKKTEEFLNEALRLFPTDTTLQQIQAYYQQKQSK